MAQRMPVLDRRVDSILRHESSVTGKTAAFTD